MKRTYLAFAVIAIFVAVTGCNNTNNDDTLNKTSKIDSGRTEESSGKKVYLHGDSSSIDSTKMKPDSLPRK